MTDDLLTPPPPAAPQPRVWRMKQPTKDTLREQLATALAERDVALAELARRQRPLLQRLREALRLGAAAHG